MPSHEPLKAGHYDIRSNFLEYLVIADLEIGTISITYEPCITRVFSSKESARTEKFRNQVRKRDGKCVAGTGQLFVDSGLHCWITNREGKSDSGIHSCQNGLLMQSSIHQVFDSFCFTINADDNYKIVSFDDDPFTVDGRILDPICRTPNSGRSVRDELLRWHFRQTVLANMRGTGEPGFELDFPPGTDMVGEILCGPAAAKRMEAELFLRLDGFSWQKGLSH
ncbi:hypothetical protein V1522DRAFT_438706 [Lipomyces starkeyi]